MAAISEPGRLPRIVIVGAGFGGLAATRALRRAKAEITLIDRRNYHLFQPLLYQVATAALSPADIAWPIRAILARQPNVRVELGRVSGVDPASREVLVEGGRRRLTTSSFSRPVPGTPISVARNGRRPRPASRRSMMPL
jgi:NADH dehydrogenase FAD-containing subunit